MAEAMHTIAVVSKLFSNFFVHEVLQGIEPHLFKGPYEVNYYPTTGRIDVEKDMLKTILYEKRADAVISISVPMDEELLQAYKNSGIPVIFIEESCEGGHTVKVDNVKGSYIATEYLIKKGHKKIGVLAGEFLDKRTNSMVIERLIGYRKAIEDYGMTLNESIIKHVAYYSFEEGRQKVREFLSEKAGLDAVFCAAGDLCAMGVIEELRENHIKIPDDISVVGYDDIMTAQYYKPALTTVKQPLEEMGSDAFELAVKCISGEVKIDEHRLIILDPKFIIRKSA
jgi:DNA-binding LacI/PurR family transcriptional regulator